MISRWTRDLTMRQVRENPSMPVQQDTFATDPECSSRLKSGTIDKPFGKIMIKLKWLWKNKKGMKIQTEYRNKQLLVAKVMLRKRKPYPEDSVIRSCQKDCMRFLHPTELEIMAASYKAKLMHLEDDMGWYTDEMREHAEKIVDDLRYVAYYIVKKVVKKYITDSSPTFPSISYFTELGRLNNASRTWEYVRVVTGMDDGDKGTEVMKDKVSQEHVCEEEVPLNNNIGKQSGDLVHMPSEAVEQGMDDHVHDEIDGAKGEQVPNHVGKKGNLEFLVCK
ncbi:hypothetical protein Tco_0599408 [Tanacetum coccineum]